MKPPRIKTLFLVIVSLCGLCRAENLTLTGELKQWHKVTLTLDGPQASETDTNPNPFTDYNFTVRFTHESGGAVITVPGYFAADGNAAHSSAASGKCWRAHFTPDKPGNWEYVVSFKECRLAALEGGGTPLQVLDGLRGRFTVAATDKAGRDFRAKGRLQYVGRHYLRFAGSGEFFLKAGADSPENLLAYEDFDGTRSLKAAGTAREGEARTTGLKTWNAHLADWKPGDPVWGKDKDRGKGLIGALNYLSAKGGNAFSFLPYNVGGDGNDVWPFAAPGDKLHYDCSKLDQWGIVFDHATRLGLYLHFKLQETEIDDNRLGHEAKPGGVPSSLDGGALGVERKLYCRELIARFGHALALNWNLGEENTQSPDEQRVMAQYIHEVDPYDHLIVIHTYPDWQDRVYAALLGSRSMLRGASLQNNWSQAHQRTLKWVRESAQAGQPWVVAHDEQNPPEMGVPADPGYQGGSGEAVQGGKTYTLHDVRKLCLWGTLMAGGAGVEYYFGYRQPQNDLGCQDWRSRDRSWDYARIALEFFREQSIPFWEMRNADELIGNPAHSNTRFCLAKPGEVYVVYLPTGGTTELDLGGASGTFEVTWFNPRAGGRPAAGSVPSVPGGSRVALGAAPAEPGEDWVVLVRNR